MLKSAVHGRNGGGNWEGAPEQGYAGLESRGVFTKPRLCVGGERPPGSAAER